MNKREKLADIATQEANRFFHGEVMGMESTIQPIADLFSMYSTKDLDGLWCAAFVYYCCVKAGFNIPARYPHDQLKLIFAGCLDWKLWAKLPENQFYYSKNDNDFSPNKGDLILYDHVFCNEPHDHIGIIVDVKDNSFLVAEGNVNNISKVVERMKNKHIRAYIRIPNDYSFISSK